MGEADRAGPWFCGPEQNRGAYVVQDIGGFEGGQGVVVRAERRTFGGDPVGYQGPVALKLLTDVADDRVATLQERWALLARIDHPSLAGPVEIFQGPGLSRRPRDDDTGPEDARDVCYVATAWVEGTGLREVSPVDPARAFRMAGDVAAGLEVLHERGLLHRDLHPGNVIVDESGRAVLIDFGAAREADGSVTTTVSGVVGFIAPECLNGPATLAADRWGLGMLTVFALLGHPQGSTRLTQFRAELAAALAGIGQRRRAVELLCRMVDTDPDQRPDDVVAWARQLTGCLSAPPGRRWRRGAAAAVGVAAVALGGATLAAEPWEDAAAPKRPTQASPPSCNRAAGGPGALQRQAASPEPADQTGQPGPPAGPAQPESADQAAQTALADAVERLAGDACLAGPPTTYAAAGVQPLTTRSGRPAGVVMVAPSGAAVRLTEAMWISYRGATGVTGPVRPEDQVTLRGYPSSVQRFDDPAGVVLQLDRSGILAGPRDDTQLFWIPGRVLDLWRLHGGVSGELGFPMSNPYRDEQGLHLEFERGTMHAYGDAAAVAEMVAGGPISPVVELHDVEATRARTDGVANGIIRQAHGTAWWVDADGVRHWIPDRAVWDCLGGAGELVVEQLRGWEVATLPVGRAATCPVAGSPDRTG